MSEHRAVTAWRPRLPCQDFAASVPATKGLIAAPWTPLASLCSEVTSAWAALFIDANPVVGSAEPVLAQGDDP